MNKQKKPAIKTLINLFPFISTILLCFSTLTVKADSLIVLSGELQSYRQVANAISQNLTTPAKVVVLDKITEPSVFNDYEEVVAVGSKASIGLFNTLPNNKKLYLTFLPSQTYKSLLAKNKNHARLVSSTVTAIYLDQPYPRQIALARFVAPNANKIATAFGPHSQKEKPQLKSAAAKYNFTLIHETLNASDNPVHTLQPLIRQADVFLSLPDKSIFNRTTAKWILYISFRQKIPLIGFSKKYVDAGAIAAVFSTPEQIGKQTAELIEKSKLNKRLPPAQFPQYFSVATNPNAAKSLRISIPTSESLSKALREGEQ
ncbi:MAG: ABC transporter substrate-binding protein [Neptuniibacter sp.]